ncbi:hypothetical protein IQ252_19150 [Tychonema sp. LEGE 07203]|nr:hypothetical protein [Tychonema sp. LEGE 07203]
MSVGRIFITIQAGCFRPLTEFWAIATSSQGPNLTVASIFRRRGPARDRISASTELGIN